MKLLNTGKRDYGNFKNSCKVFPLCYLRGRTCYYHLHAIFVCTCSCKRGLGEGCGLVVVDVWSKGRARVYVCVFVRDCVASVWDSASTFKKMLLPSSHLETFVHHYFLCFLEVDCGPDNILHIFSQTFRNLYVHSHLWFETSTFIWSIHGHLLMSVSHTHCILH